MIHRLSVPFIALVAMLCAVSPVLAQTAGSKPNIMLIVSDDFGWGDARVYGGGVGRGMPTPALDREQLKKDGINPQMPGGN